MMTNRRHLIGSAFMLLLLTASLTVAFAAGWTRLEPRPWTPVADSDMDRDGIPDLFDFCPARRNLGAPDRDHDGISDDCDLSPDGDGAIRLASEARRAPADAPRLTLASAGP